MNKKITARAIVFHPVNSQLRGRVMIFPSALTQSRFSQRLSDSSTKLSMLFLRARGKSPSLSLISMSHIKRQLDKQFSVVAGGETMFRLAEYRSGGELEGSSCEYSWLMASLIREQLGLERSEVKLARVLSDRGREMGLDFDHWVCRVRCGQHWVMLDNRFEAPYEEHLSPYQLHSTVALGSLTRWY